ncbi:hypothetical protein C8A01DRAFT_49404 [Parachaetomium inaequale]|uniref:Uncharacterized protein n=1 Tax=Parachaetomium inaequale TaxID=2588326 RepID=A0AAN6SNT9_9PEZI|nr:hypothetical protein C8A01DRAFT_49404 [Parachaetomium inaequale]
MASQTTSDLPARPASPASSEDEHHAELVWLEVSMIDEILDYIVSSRQSDTESIFGFHWQASQVDNLSEQLDARLVVLNQPKIRRFEYDYKSETVYLDIIGESVLHYKVQIGLRDYIKNHIAKLLAIANDPTIRDSLRSIDEPGTANIKSDGKIFKQADVSFGQAGTLPSLVCEVSKACQYINCSDADGPSSDWVQHSELFYDDGLDQQPVGQVDLYLSDFVGLAGVPTACCRPSSAELAAGVSRTPQIILMYERLAAIFRVARHMHSPTEFATEIGDEEQNPYEVAERRVAEARNEERNETERRVAEARNETERPRKAAEIERCVAEGRLGPPSSAPEMWRSL